MGFPPLVYWRPIMQRARILILDDDDDRLENRAWLFIKEGFRVTGVRTGFEALRDMAVERPDLVVVNVDAGSMALNGRDVVERMAQDENLCAIPTIVMSANVAHPWQLPANMITLLNSCSHMQLLVAAERLLSLPQVLDVGEADADLSRH